MKGLAIGIEDQDVCSITRCEYYPSIWYNYTVSPVGLVESRDMLLDAKAFRDSIQAGEVKAASEVTPASTNDDEDIPF